MTEQTIGDAETIEGLRARLLQRHGEMLAFTTNRPSLVRVNPSDVELLLDAALALATLRESLAKAEGERDEALHMVATGAYAAALKAPPSSVYHHSLALSVEFFRKAEARALRAEAQVAEAKEALGRIAGFTDPDSDDSYRGDDREGCLDATYSLARSTLSSLDKDAGHAV